MIRAAVGTNSVDCCARICHSPTAWGMQQTFGTGAATNSTEDIYHADLFLIIGANPTNAHPCLLYTSPSPRDQRGSRMPSSA